MLAPTGGAGEASAAGLFTLTGGAEEGAFDGIIDGAATLPIVVALPPEVVADKAGSSSLAVAIESAFSRAHTAAGAAFPCLLYTSDAADE